MGFSFGRDNTLTSMVEFVAAVVKLKFGVEVEVTSCFENEVSFHVGESVWADLEYWEHEDALWTSVHGDPYEDYTGFIPWEEATEFLLEKLVGPDKNK